MIESFFILVLSLIFGLICVSPFILMFVLLFNIWNTDFYNIKGDKHGH